MLFFVPMLDRIIILIMCHLLGDYFFQNDFLAKTKGENPYHLVVHSALYCFPFMVVCGINFSLFVLFALHIVIDAMKARFNTLNYVQDQFFHYLLIFILYIFPFI